MIKRKNLVLFFTLITVLLFAYSGYAKSGSTDFPLTFNDSTGQSVSIVGPPKRIVSLVPSITEMIAAIGAESLLVGLTSSATPTPAINQKVIVGSFLHPDIDQVKRLNPDIIFYSNLQKNFLKHYDGKAQRIHLKQESLQQGFDHLRLLGKITNKSINAEQIIQRQQDQIELIGKKVKKINDHDKPRTIRLMGQQNMVPGDDSFQNEYIKAAGGIPPRFGKSGDVAPISLKEWQEFNPEVIYGCGNKEKLLSLLQEDGWRDVSAVQNNRIFTFPCKLTCRAATNMGNFISTLSTRLHNQSFSKPDNLVAPEQIQTRFPLEVPLSYIQGAEIINSRIYDFINKTLLLSFTQPMTILSSLEGWRENITYVGNHYFPRPSWGLGHNQGVLSLKEQTLKILELEDHSTALLFTGADMDNLAIVEKSHKDMKVIALVTAGVNGNAVRMSADTGNFYELAGHEKPKKPGTINIVLLTNTTLSPRAMTRGIISATEAKTAALYDLDIRSSYSGDSNPATGTGTDNIIVIQGKGLPIDASGGHTKMGELMARAVHDGVLEAIGKQNGFTASRSVFQRLKERKIEISTLAKIFNDSENYTAELNNLLSKPLYSGFLEEAMVLSDSQQRGLISNNVSFLNHCQTIASEIAGENISIKPLESPAIPPILRQAFGALFSAIEMRKKK